MYYKLCILKTLKYYTPLFELCVLIVIAWMRLVYGIATYIALRSNAPLKMASQLF